MGVNNEIAKNGACWLYAIAYFYYGKRVLAFYRPLYHNFHQFQFGKRYSTHQQVHLDSSQKQSLTNVLRRKLAVGKCNFWSKFSMLSTVCISTGDPGGFFRFTRKIPWRFRLKRSAFPVPVFPGKYAGGWSGFVRFRLNRRTGCPSLIWTFLTKLFVSTKTVLQREVEVKRLKCPSIYSEIVWTEISSFEQNIGF